MAFGIVEKLTDVDHSFGSGLKKQKLLAFHGHGSNQFVTDIHLHNIGLGGVDVHSPKGVLKSDQPGLGLPQDTAQSWFSWFPTINEIKQADAQSCMGILCNALAAGLEVIQKNGKFEFFYGFSQGAVLARLLNGLPKDPKLVYALAEHGVIIPEDMLLSSPTLFTKGVFACAAGQAKVDLLREKTGIGPMPAIDEAFGGIHLIGKQDSLRSESEVFCQQYSNNQTNIFYMDSEHEVQLHGTQTDKILACLDQLNNATTSYNYNKYVTSDSSYREVSETIQYARVTTETTRWPSTLLDTLRKASVVRPLLRNARETDVDLFTSYGDLLTFIQGGEGDLRRLGVTKRQKVGYVLPSGGGARSAVAFLSISSQVCAVPLSSSLTESDALVALRQFELDHIILFDDVACPGVKQAVDVFNKVKAVLSVHIAEQEASQALGLFRFKSQIPEPEMLSFPLLQSTKDDNALLLRTSGTTSLPKVVPLRQIDLIHNAHILAEGLGLTQEDITYSVMPLDHIGGISGSILATVAVGATMSCDAVYTPQTMVDALLHSVPQPTWFSAVPTIHNATRRYIESELNGQLDTHGRLQGHKLRFVRSGAAALRQPDQAVLRKVYNCDVITTYSMSELMPICQPPIEQQGWHQQPGSVGAPVMASMVIIDTETMLPLPFGQIGEICIRGDSVFTGYLNNPQANLESSVLLTLEPAETPKKWFRTGDLGRLSEVGMLFLNGRSKEMIKRGGEQISPFEVEEKCAQLDLVELAICFSVPSDVYGEEVGVAIVPSTEANTIPKERLIKQLRQYLRDQRVPMIKIPTVWRVVEKTDLPRTKSGKYIRNKCSEALAITKSTDDVDEKVAASACVQLSNKPTIDNSAMAGLRFLLACYVMFMHIGSTGSWQEFSNLRQFPWHVHMFFAVAGFSLAITIPDPIKRKSGFILSRIMSFYPLYLVAIGFALLNLLAFCSPSSFNPVFQWIGDSSEVGQCYGTPVFQNSWWANLGSTLIIHLAGLQASPLWQGSWWMGFYLWFISMYIQCLIFFPFAYNLMYRLRTQTFKLLVVAGVLLAANFVILLGFWWFYAESAPGYGLYSADTGMRLQPSLDQVAKGAEANTNILSFYLFAPFWAVYFIAGVTLAFIYDAVRPNERLNKVIWGRIADGITCIIIVLSILQILQGYIGLTADGVSVQPYFMRPEAANQPTDAAIVNRIWDNIYPRLMAPMTLLWVFAIATGQGWTARILRRPFISRHLAPTALGCFLFHQMVAQWYYFATRGELWNWWDYQKGFYWFSPNPAPVEWYEYFYIVGLVVLFVKMIEPLDPILRRLGSRLLRVLRGNSSSISQEEQTPIALVLSTVEGITGLSANPEDTLEECGLASLSLVQFVGALENADSQRIGLSLEKVLAASNLLAVAEIVEIARKEITPVVEEQVLQ